MPAAAAAGVLALAGIAALALRSGGGVHAILHQDADIDATIAALLARPFRDEAEN